MSYTGNSDLSFIAKSNLVSKKNNKKGKVWDIPENLYSPIKQDAIMLLSGKRKKSAKIFLDYLASDLIKQKIKGFGYFLE